MNLPLALRAVTFRTVDVAPVITKYGVLNKHAISWMTLSSYRPLEAHLWRPVVQSDAKMQRVFRSYWNHYTYQAPSCKQDRHNRRPTFILPQV
jgi:hypothetical protein